MAVSETNNKGRYSNNSDACTPEEGFGEMPARRVEIIY